MSRQSVILDDFSQISNDLLPFWGLGPEHIRQDLALVASQPDIALFKIISGKVSHNADSTTHASLDELANMIQGFAEHLPDMEFAVNLNDRPRVLASWEDVQAISKATNGAGLGKQLSRASNLFQSSSTTAKDKPQEALLLEDMPDNDIRKLTSAQAVRQWTGKTCRPGSTARSNGRWNMRDSCSACTRPQSDAHFLNDWTASQNLCHQPDLSRLHGFNIKSPALSPFQHLLPVFSRAKTTSYNDILIPLPWLNNNTEDEQGVDFNMKTNQLFWRGHMDGSQLSHDLLHGGHRQRLVHIINNSSASDRVMTLLPQASNKDRWVYESVLTSELSKVLPINVGISEFLGCQVADCAMQRREFGKKEWESPFRSRYTLIMDGDDGPSAELIPALRSGSVPFVASVFREWYTERLMPWVHFVPIDIRYHAIHSTLAYFVGLKDRGAVNGRTHDTDGRLEDAKWIAEQGKQWAKKAIRREDMEIYLFRLLLEWGRLIDDKRDDLGFKMNQQAVQS